MRNNTTLEKISGEGREEMFKARKLGSAYRTDLLSSSIGVIVGRLSSRQVIPRLRNIGTS